MVDPVGAPYAILLLRLCLAAMFIAHAMLKVRVFTIPGTVAFFKSLGLPGWLAYVTIAAELGGAACLILGIYPRYVALLLVPLILGTIVTVHGKKGMALQQCRRRLGISGVLGGRTGGCVPAGRWCWHACIFARPFRSLRISGSRN